jgi:hypothetical protein
MVAFQPIGLPGLPASRRPRRRLDRRYSDYDCDILVRRTPLVVDTRNAAQNVTHGREKICKA